MSSVAAAPLGPRERLHPLFLLTGLGATVRGAWGMVALVAWMASQGRWWLVALIAGGSLVVSIGGLLIRWLKLEYRVGEHEIRIDSGFLERNSRAIPFDRIQDVDIEQGPVQRLLGLAQVRFETGAAAGGNDGILHTISLERAEALRRLVRANRTRVSALAPATPLGTALAEGEPLFAMTNRRLVIAGLFNFSLAVLAGLFGLSQTVGDVAGFDPFSRSFWNEALAQSAPLQAYFLAHQIAVVLAGAVLLLAIGTATGIVRTVLRDYRFRLDRVARAFRRRRGLLTLTDVSLPLARVQAAIVATGPLRRALGWFELKLQSLAHDEAGKGDHVVAPLAHPEEIEGILAELGWPSAPPEPTWKNVSRAYLHLFLLAMVPLALIGAAQALFLPLLGAVSLIAVAAASLVRILAWPRTRYALDGEHLFIEGGWWNQHRLLLPRTKVQSADVSDNALTRLFGVATVRLGVAGGGGWSVHSVSAIPRDVAFDLRRAILA
jgi:putative membrane protein